MDQSIKIYDLKKPGYENEPMHEIFDHDEEIIAADIRQSDGLMASLDIGGTILVRSLKADAEQILYTLRDMPLGPDDYTRLLLNQEIVKI